MSQAKLNEYQLRPRYKFENERNMTELRKSLVTSISQEPDLWPLKFKDTHGHLIFSFKAPHKHTWSPEMDLNLERKGEGTLIRVLIGPAAGVWTFFMFLYAICALLLVGGFVLSYSQFVLEKNIWGFWLIPIAALGAVGIYLAGLYGKSKAIPQMIFLKKFFDTALPKSILLEGDLRNV